MEVLVRVPATTANLGPGFDSIGMALELTGEVRVGIWGGRPQSREAAGEAIVVAAVEAVYAQAGEKPHLGLGAQIIRNIPAGRGLGASAFARAAGLVAANAMLGGRLSGQQLLDLGAELEGHPDNIVPALLGGLRVMARDEGRLVHVRVPVATGLSLVALVPDFDMPTDESRRRLPAKLSREDAVFNIGRSALLVAALATGEFSALRTATQDRLHQPARAEIFPPLRPVIAAALEAGAAGAFLSGGGSSVMAMTVGQEDAVGRAMVEAAARFGVPAEYLKTRPGESGAAVSVRR